MTAPLHRITGLAIAAALAATAVVAQTAPAPTGPATPQLVQVAPGQAVVVQSLPPASWTPLQTKQAFDLADSDGNGELSRAEGQRLSILPKPFEEMDANKDGVLNRAEYEASFRR
ncbi:MAG: EF-hand domain-containing protein [Pseudomonadota bacterium]